MPSMYIMSFYRPGAIDHHMEERMASHIALRIGPMKRPTFLEKQVVYAKSGLVTKSVSGQWTADLLLGVVLDGLSHDNT